MRILYVAMLVVGCGASTPKQKSSTVLDGVPPPAAATLREKAGAATIERVERETENGVEVYEAQWHVKGHEWEASVTAGGDLVELEIEIDLAEVPEPVRVSAVSALAGATAIKYRQLLHDRYEAEAIINGTEREITILSTGDIESTEQPGDDADDPPPPE